MRQYLNKLVKGKSSEIIKQSGNGLKVRTLSKVEYLQGLKNRLIEEFEKAA